MHITREQIDQLQTATAALRDNLEDALLAVYLHGSAASGNIHPQSDIDLLAIVDRGLTEDQRDALLTTLLQISSRHPAVPNGRRCIEVVVFLLSDLAVEHFPVRTEFIYGEWLRDAYEAGEKPAPTHDPEYSLLLAQARQDAVPLFGPDASEMLPEISNKHVRLAMRGMLPVLLKGLLGDERNALLTLARMWRTASTGEFVTKNEAATWAIPHIQNRDAVTLDYARRAYLGEIADDWNSRGDAAQRLAEHLGDRINKLLHSDGP